MSFPMVSASTHPSVVAVARAREPVQRLHAAVVAVDVHDRGVRMRGDIVGQGPDRESRREGRVIDRPPARAKRPRGILPPPVPELPPIERLRALVADGAARAALATVLVCRLEDDLILDRVVPVPVDLVYQERPLLAVVLLVGRV